MVAAAGMLAVGCGRVGFDPVGDAGTGELTIAYPRYGVTAVLGVTAFDLTPVVSDPDAVIDVSPPLPAGTLLDAHTGRLTGVPLEAADGVYTFAAHLGDERATTTLDILVADGVVVTTGVDMPSTDTTRCLTASGECSVRAAVEHANATGPTLILVPNGGYALMTALPDLATDVTIAGAGAGVTELVPGIAIGAFRMAANHTLRLRDLSADNFSTDKGSAVRLDAGRAVIERCSFATNHSTSSGGVIFAPAGTAVEITDSTFTNNSSDGGPGGGWGGVIDAEGAGTTVRMTGSTATGNHAAYGAVAHITSGVTMRIENSTLYGNASTQAGTLASPGGAYTLVNDTIVGNTNSNAVADSAGLYLYQVPATYDVSNTIVFGNTDATGHEHDCNRRDTATTLTSGGGNFFGDAGGNCASFFPSDHFDVRAGVTAGAPAAHGGPTATLPLLESSPARGGGITCPPTDQRGRPRPSSGCDAGAVEGP